jgi:hypothetical protein
LLLFGGFLLKCVQNAFFSRFQTLSNKPPCRLGLSRQNRPNGQNRKNPKMAEETEKTQKIGKEVARKLQNTIRKFLKTVRALGLITLAA